MNPASPNSSNDPISDPAICQRCGGLLTPGKGDFYIVNVEAYAENGPLVITQEDLEKDHVREMAEIIRQLKDVSPQEAMDQVQRHMTFYLCRRCYKKWIENPVG